MIKYRLTQCAAAPIEPVEVISETATAYLIREQCKGAARIRNERKKSLMHSYHESWPAAHAALVESAERKVSTANKVLAETKERLAIVKAMKQPAAKP
jgi:3-methyladenine DNA glycosylase Tag